MATGKKKASGITTKHSCPICDHSFRSKRDLASHPCSNPAATTKQPAKPIKALQRRGILSKAPISKGPNPKKLKNGDEVAGVKSHRCLTCGNSYRFAHGLRNHQAKHDPVAEKPFACSQCGKTFSQRAFLTIHLRTHTDERPYDCKTCGKAFHQRSHLRYHLMTHSSKSNHKCSICGKKLRYKQSLQLHLRIHNQEKNFSCDICGKAFYEKPKLKIHRRVHTGEKPYVCSICGRGFAQKGNCDKHKERYHARDGERRFPCNVCPKAFIWKKCLDMHLSWHELEKKRSRKSRKKCTSLDGTVSNVVDVNLGLPKPDDVGSACEEEEEEEEEGEADDAVTEDCDMLTLWQDGKCIIRRIKKDGQREQTLKENMAKLLPFLLDDEVLLEIGWPEKPVAEMVIQVLRWCDQKPAIVKEEMPNGEEAFHKNVRLLLNIVLEEKFTEVNDVQEKTPNEIVAELLKFCKIT